MGHNGFDMFEPTIRCIIIQLPSVVILGDNLQGTFCAGQFVGKNLGEIALV